MSAPTGWLLVQREDAPDEDRERVDALAATLGDAATVRRTADPEALDEAVADLDGRVLVVCGGDGSIHAAANRLAATDRLDGTTVALFPAGTGNDLAHTLDLPLDPEPMAELLRGGRTTDLDLLDLSDGTVAVNAVHVGIGVEAAERSAGLPEGLGALAYPLGALLAGVQAEGFEGHVEVDDEVVCPVPADPVLMVFVGNGRTIGGGHVFAPDAAPDDGQLDVLVCQATGLAARAAFGVAVTRGTHVDREDVALARGTRVRITGSGLRCNVDGELDRDPADLVEVTVRPGVLRFVVPGH